MVHLITMISDSYVELPWSSDQWTSIYVDPIDIIVDNMNGIVDVYTTEVYLSVILRKEQGSLFHYAFPIIKSSLEYSLLQNVEQTHSFESSEEISSRISLQQKINLVSKSVSKQISESIPEMDDKTRMNISQIASHKSTVLNPLFPLFLDDEVEEIYLDALDTSVYFDHNRLGRVETEWTPSQVEVTRLVTLLRSESNLHLDRKNPSMKTDFVIYDTPLRFSITVPPLASEGIHLEIRRAKNQQFTIMDLISNDTLSIEAAAMLILAVNSRMNITITGGPGVGKTTLMNALDKVTPKIWRKLYIEDTIESRLYNGHHQIRIRVDPVDELGASFDKVTEIVKSLHRSPDYLILGEIQTEDHSNALFQSLAAGLRSIQTCHSATPQGLITRWTRNHGIDDASIALMDLIVSLNRPQPGDSTRFVSEIVEIRRSVEDGVFVFNGLNTVYKRLDSSECYPWADDGAFNRLALEQGMKSHLPAFNRIVSELNTRITNGDKNTSNLSQKLWENGHPMLLKPN
ncbi:MAG: ATPase, T2SS/T4P/T4SS family [Candidatus Thorarchaeota archaeon]